MTNKSNKENKIFNINNFSNWIIGGIIAFIITKMSEPLSKFLFSNILNIGGSLITHISNSTYREISNGYSEQSSSITLYLVYILIIFLLTYAYFIFFKKYNDYKIKLKKFFNSIDNATTTSELNNIVIPKDIHEQNLEKSKIKNMLKSNNLSFLIDTFWVLSLFLIITFFYGQSDFIRNKTIAITNNIEIVSPYISDIEYTSINISQLSYGF